MSFNSKKICLSLLLYSAGSFALVETKLGFHGLMLKYKLRAKISELINNYEGFFSSKNDAIKTFIEKRLEQKIYKLAHQTDEEAKNIKESHKKINDLSLNAKLSFSIKNDDSRNAVSMEKHPTSLQTKYTFQCLDALNDEHLLRSLENKSVLMDEIFSCMNAAEQQAQE